MRLIFAGTPEFAAAALAALHDAGHDIALVLSQPDRPAGRGMKLTPSAVKQAAGRRGLKVAQPVSLKTPEAQDALRAVGADLMVVAAYGLILPQTVLDIPRRGCLNIHASLLPRWRGAAPIQRAILAGDRETGITIMQMDAGLDTGAMLLKAPLPIALDDTAGSLHDKLAQSGAASIVEALSRLDTLTPQLQDNTLATYAAKLTKEEARLDWARAAEDLVRAVRGYNPVPGAHTLLSGNGVKIWQAAVRHAAIGAPARGTPPDTRPSGGLGAAPGEVLEADERGIVVACGRDALRLTELQMAGGKRMSAAAFVAGHALRPGSLFGH